jgi:hypothetical protein
VGGYSRRVAGGGGWSAGSPGCRMVPLSNRGLTVSWLHVRQEENVEAPSLPPLQHHDTLVAVHGSAAWAEPLM